jgi:hypothetical protein
MVRSHVAAIALSALFALAGCGHQQTPTIHSRSKDWAELEARYEALGIGAIEPEIATIMGKRGAMLVGNSALVVKRKPDGAPAIGTGESERYWASEDHAGAIRVVFRSDGKSRLIELLRIAPNGSGAGAK